MKARIARTNGFGADVVPVKQFPYVTQLGLRFLILNHDNSENTKSPKELNEYRGIANRPTEAVDYCSTLGTELMCSDPIIEALLRDAAASLRIANNRSDAIRDAVHLFLRRACDAHLSPGTIGDLFAVAGDCVLNRACPAEGGEQAALDAYAAYDGFFQEANSMSLTPRSGSSSHV